MATQITPSPGRYLITSKDEYHGEVRLGTASAEPSDSDAASGTSSPSGVDASFAAVPDCANLSPSSLMAYCEARLDSLDGQMNQIFEQQQKNGTLTNDVNQIAASLNDLPAASGTPPTVTLTQAQIDTTVAAYNTAITDAGGTTTQLGNSLNQDLIAFQKYTTGTSPTDGLGPVAAALLGLPGSSLAQVANGGNPAISADNLTQLQQNLKNDASSLNSDSEMSMINLQSLMSQRQTAVQLTTNLVQSLGEQMNDIAKNIGA